MDGNFFSDYPAHRLARVHSHAHNCEAVFKCISFFLEHPLVICRKARPIVIGVSDDLINRRIVVVHDSKVVFIDERFAGNMGVQRKDDVIRLDSSKLWCNEKSLINR